jgi:hypothetical protein
MIGRRGLLAVFLTAGFGVPASAPSQAQSYPDRPIRIIVAAAPGGPSDFPARLASQVHRHHRRASRFRIITPVPFRVRKPENAPNQRNFNHRRWKRRRGGAAIAHIEPNPPGDDK